MLELRPPDEQQTVELVELAGTEGLGHRAEGDRIAMRRDRRGAIVATWGLADPGECSCSD